MIEFSRTYGCWIWSCEWGHYAIDFEGEQGALDDFKKHDCRMTL